MTEAEWLESRSVPTMLQFLRDRVSDEKLRHFIRAAAVIVWAEEAERWDLNSLESTPRDWRPGVPTLIEVAESVSHHAAFKRAMPPTAEARAFCKNGMRAQAALLREIVGNPFRPVALAPEVLTWNDGAIAKMARAIHEDRAFDRLPILADALEDAGCTDTDILTHCRGANVHVRGCWVLDLLGGRG